MTTSEQSETKPMSERKQRKQFVDTITGWLEESSPQAKAQIYMIVKMAGMARTMDLLKEVLAIEESGGMLTADTSHRRTVGGVFFYLAKQKGYNPVLSPEERKARWRKTRARIRAKKKLARKQQGTPSYPDVPQSSTNDEKPLGKTVSAGKK